MNPAAGYTLLEHTADAGLIAWGPTPAEAFSQATWGMFAIIVGQDLLELQLQGEREPLHLYTQGEMWDELLVRWLAEVLMYFDTYELIPQRINFITCEPPDCTAELECIRIRDLSVLGGVGVKAITYHQLYVEVDDEYRTELRVIFDI